MTDLPPQAEALVTTPFAGAPLSELVRQPLEKMFDIDLGDVRVHTEPAAASAVDGLRTRAFTYGTHIYLGRAEAPDDLRLMAHEVTHVVQQQGAPVFQLFGASGVDRFEREAQQAANTSHTGGRVNVAERTGGPRVQGADALVSLVPDWLKEQVWSTLERYAPGLVPILRRGVLEWLKDRLSAAVQTIVDFVARPVRAVADVVTGVRSHFTNLLAWMRDAAARIARGDCGAIAEAADKIYQVFEGLTAPVIDRIKEYVGRVKGFFQGLWERFGAPIWDLLKTIGGAIWEEVERVGRWIWDQTRPVRDLLSSAWTWLKGVIGIGEGEEGQNGILQWFQRKAGTAWDWVMERIAPFKRQLLIIGGVLVMLSPAGPIIAVAAATAGILRGIQWLRQNMKSRDAVVQQQGFLRGTILPAILNAIDSVSSAVNGIATTITTNIGRVVTAVGDLGNIVGSIPIVGFARGLVDFIAAGFRGLLTWASEGVQGLAGSVQSGLERLRGFTRRLADALEEIMRLVGNFLRIGGSIFRRIWNAIPACVRDPFVDWFIPLILKNIPFFSELANTPEAWAQTKAQVSTLLVQVFVNFDLIGAMKSIFGLVVRVLRVPVELLDQLIDKASQAWDLVLAKPMVFIENAFRAILRGLGRFMSNILSHLWFGVQGWLFKSVSNVGISPPSSWTDVRAVFGFVLDVLGISVNHVIDLIDKRVPGAGRVLRTAIRILTGALEWIRIAIDEGPRGLWQHLMQGLGDLSNAVLGAAVGWVMGRVVTIVSARIAALAASAGLSAVLEAVKAVYSAIKTAIEYMPMILGILIRVFDTIVQIAGGIIDPAAEMIEAGMHMAMPVVIGFLANYAGLGGLGGRIREIILDVRERVDKAILGLIDRVLDLIRSVLRSMGIGRAGGAAAEFGEASDRHRVLVEETGGRRRTMINPAPPVPATVALDAIDARIEAEIPAQAGRAAAKALATSIRSQITTWESAPGAPALGSQAYVDQLAARLGPLYALIGHPDAPETEIQPPSTTSFGSGRVVEAKPLTRRPPKGTIGQSTRNSVLASDTDMKVLNSVRQEWVKMHLLSFRLHGPDAAWNFAPGTKVANTAMERVEGDVDEALKQEQGKKVMYYRTTVVYRTKTKPPPSPDETKFPQLVSIARGTYRAYDPVKDKNSFPPDLRTVSIESPSPTLGAASLSSASIDDMVAKGVDRVFAGAIFDGRRNRPYRNAEDVAEAIAYTARFNPERQVGAVPQFLRMAGTLNSLAAGGQVVFNDQEV